MSRTHSPAARRQPPISRSFEQQPQLALPLEPLTVRIPVAVRITGIGRSKLYELIKAGEVEVVKIGSSTLVNVASLRRLVQRGSA